MTERNWRGSFAIPMTPYDEDDRIDEDALRAEIQFCIESGVGGLCVPVMVSEFRLLSEAERRTMIRIPVKMCEGTGIPVVANCAAVNTPLAVEYARYAEGAGAAAVIAMPPYVFKQDFGSVFAYYQAISDAVGIPVWIQNTSVTALSLEQVVRLCTEIDNVSWVKEEVPPSTHSIGSLVGMGCPAVEGVMGGSGGLYLFTERARGSKGVIHACEFCDVLQRIWDLLDEGENGVAEDLFEILMPGIVGSGGAGVSAYRRTRLRYFPPKNW